MAKTGFNILTFIALNMLYNGCTTSEKNKAVDPTAPAAAFTPVDVTQNIIGVRQASATAAGTGIASSNVDNNLNAPRLSHEIILYRPGLWQSQGCDECVAVRVLAAANYRLAQWIIPPECIDQADPRSKSLPGVTFPTNFYAMRLPDRHENRDAANPELVETETVLPKFTAACVGKPIILQILTERCSGVAANCRDIIEQSRLAIDWQNLVALDPWMETDLPGIIKPSRNHGG